MNFGVSKAEGIITFQWVIGAKILEISIVEVF